MRSGPEFTLGDLLDHDELGLQLVVGGPRARERPVIGAHTIEVEHPTQWLDADWVMLTSGLALGGTSTQRDLVAELDDAGIAALGLGLGVGADDATVPAGLLAEAARRDFPVFVVPLQTPFREVTGVVFRGVLSDELRAAGRLAAMHRFLVDALGEEAPRPAVLGRLAALLGATVAVLRGDGRVVLSTGALPGPRIARAVAGRAGATVGFEVDWHEGVAVRTGDPWASAGDPDAWLVVAAREGQRLHPLTRAAAQATAPLLLAISRLEDDQRRRERAVRDATLDGLLTATDTHDLRVAAARALTDGVDVGRGVVVAVIAPAAEDTVPALERAAARQRLAMLARVEPAAQRVVALLPAGAGDAPLAAWAHAAGAGARVGVGRSVSDPAAIRHSLADAELALAEAARRPPSATPPVVRYDDLDFAAVLAREIASERLAPKLDGWVEPLRSNTPVYETVVAYLDCELDVGRTARRLGVHPNSVRYRLARAQELLGAPVRAPRTIAALHLALERERRG